jgi:hypothetical protein
VGDEATRDGPAGAVKGGRSPAKRTLDGACGTVQSSKAECGIVAWTQTRQTNGFIEALNGLFQAAKRKARGYTRFATMRTVIFLIAGKLDFTPVNPYAA